MVALEAGAIDAVFDVHPLPARPYELGPFRVQSRPLPHFVPTVGVRLEADGLAVAYTGDTGPDPALAEVGRGADLYIVEATDRDPDRTASGALDLTGREAGRAAADAGARRLLLTHFWPYSDREATRAAAAAEFGGEILVAQEGLEIDLP